MPAILTHVIGAENWEHKERSLPERTIHTSIVVACPDLNPSKNILVLECSYLQPPISVKFCCFDHSRDEGSTTAGNFSLVASASVHVHQPHSTSQQFDRLKRETYYTVRPPTSYLPSLSSATKPLSNSASQHSLCAPGLLTSNSSTPISSLS